METKRDIFKGDRNSGFYEAFTKEEEGLIKMALENVDYNGVSHDNGGVKSTRFFVDKLDNSWLNKEIARIKADPMLLAQLTYEMSISPLP